MHNETCMITKQGEYGPMTVDLCKLLGESFEHAHRATTKVDAIV